MITWVVLSGRLCSPTARLIGAAAEFGVGDGLRVDGLLVGFLVGDFVGDGLALRRLRRRWCRARRFGVGNWALASGSACDRHCDERRIGRPRHRSRTRVGPPQSLRSCSPPPPRPAPPPSPRPVQRPLTPCTADNTGDRRLGTGRLRLATRRTWADDECARRTLVHERLFIRSPGVFEGIAHLSRPDALIEQAVSELTDLKATTSTRCRSRPRRPRP